MGWLTWGARQRIALALVVSALVLSAGAVMAGAGGHTLRGRRVFARPAVGAAISRPARRIALPVALHNVSVPTVALPAAAVPAAPRGETRLAGTLAPAVLHPAGVLRAAAIAPAEEHAMLRVTIVLNRAHPAQFARFLAAVQDPRSPQFRHFLSLSALTARFGPSREAYDAVLSWLRGAGLPDVRGSADRLTVSARGTRSQLQRLFAVRIGDFRLGSRRVFANLAEPAIPRRLAGAIQAVLGLSNTGAPRPEIASVPRRAGAAEAVAARLRSLGRDLARLRATGGGLALRPTGGFAAPFAAFGRTAPFAIRPMLQGGPPPTNGDCNIDIGTLLGNNPCEGILADSCWELLQLYITSPFSGEVIEDEKNYECAADELDLVNAYVSSLSAQRPGAPLGAHRAPRTRASVGAGQRIGLLEFDTYAPSDVSDFLALAGDNPTEMANLSQVPVDGGIGSPGAWQAEVLLDIDAAMSLAPAAQVVVYDAPQSGTGFVDEFNAMLADHDTVISNSWVSCENLVTPGEAQAIDSVLQQAAASGVAVLNASGDEGNACFGFPGVVAVPADSPHATAVGGTTFSGGVDGTYGSESWWDNSGANPPGGQGGYGVSQYFGTPAYQSGLASGGRSIPDIVSNADPNRGYEICEAAAGGCPAPGLFGGTSVSTPMLAALVADVQQQVGSSLAPLNPVLYSLNGSSAFHSAQSMGSDFAHVGLGSPNLDQLALAVSHRQPGPASGSASTLQGLPFPDMPADGATPDIIVAKVTDAAGNELAGQNVTLTANSSTVHITPASGSVATTTDNGTAVFRATDTVAENVTFTAVDTSAPGGNLTLPTLDVTFASPPADSGGIATSSATEPADGSTSATITVTLQTLGQGAAGKTVTLTPNTGTHSTIIGPTPALTGSNGQVTFAVSDPNNETVTYTATDVTDGNLPVPGSAQVAFGTGSGGGGGGTNGEPCASGTPTAAAGFAFTNFAVNIPSVSSCQGPIGIAFDSAGNLLAEDSFSNQLFRFGPSGGSGSPATLVGSPSGLSARMAGIAFGQDGELYAGEYCGDLIQLDPTTAQPVRTVVPANGNFCPTGLAVDPLSGDLFFTDTCLDGGWIYRVRNPSSPNPPAPTSYVGLPCGADGIAFAPDGTMYLAGGNGWIYSVSGTNVPGPPTVTQLAQINGGPDGIAVEPASDGSAQALFVNVNNGTIVELSSLTGTVQQTPVFGGGSRGDFVTVGPDGCLYATQTDRIIRVTAADLSCPFVPSSQAPQINLVPVPQGASTAATGATAAFRAQLINVPSPQGIPITFTVVGSNTLAGPTGNTTAGIADAAADGSAPFSYTGLRPGTDTVIAHTVINGTTVSSPPVQFTWTQGPDVSALSLSATPQGGALGMAVRLTAALTDLTAAPHSAIAGAPVQLTLQGQSCQATTDSAGVGSCTVTPPGPAGPQSVTASYAGDSSHTSASASAPFEVSGGTPPRNAGPPAISGQPAVGQTLTCQPGTWTGQPTPYSYSYSWSRDGTTIPGATGSTYLLTAADGSHAVSCTVIAANSAGSGSPATSPAVNVPTPPPAGGGGSPPPGGGSPPPGGGSPPPKPGVPKLLAPPAVSGSALPGHTLSCSSGTWSNGPTSFAYAWMRDGSAISGAARATYVVQIPDEARHLSCAVTTANAAGASAPAQSGAVLVAVRGTLHCPAPTGALRGTAVGPLSLGQLRSAARKRLPRFGITYNDLDNFCLFAGWGIRVGYPSRRLLRHVPAGVAAKVTGRIVLALTANPFYALDGARPGTKLAAVARRLHLGKPFRVGLNLWYFAPGRTVIGVLKVRAGVIQEVGIATPLLTHGRAAQGQFISSFNGSAP